MNAHGPVALHIAVTPDRTSSCPQFTYASLEQQQVHNFLDGIYSVLVLCESHGPASNDLFSMLQRLYGLQHQGFL